MARSPVSFAIRSEKSVPHCARLEGEASRLEMMMEVPRDHEATLHLATACTSARVVDSKFARPAGKAAG